ncbi:MAG: dihydrofolate reductase [Oceanicoccus sp.]|uniref:dihydrofolate reductase n=1 Tax=Oceanicoccus sp. TaxID=2691044 RepID=UPI002612BBD6|nr:dihydrofolate reductase [Oceanicoccus sp.]MCP3906599.1 dihydrofolate reductase [Oceanicoccus sp.]MDG1772755.1 dihydrofolate reductase [Oceanicoccus sp.]
MSEEFEVRIAMIVAMAENRVIGRNNQLPWYLPNDLKYFKAVTMGKPIIMGRKTYESIGKPLPGRTNIVVTTQPSWTADGVRVAHSIDEALTLAQSVAIVEGADEVMIIGGAQLYTDMLDRVERLYLTLIHAEVEGDAHFPELDLSLWNPLSREDFAAEGPNPYDYSFAVYGCND